MFKIKKMNENKISFWKIFWPTLIAMFIATITWLLVFFGVIGGIVASISSDSKEIDSKKIILRMTLEGNISENSSSTINPYALSIDKKVGLSDLLFGIKKAASDPTVDGIYLELKNVQCGISTVREIRNALIDFQKSGKYILAYHSGEMISFKQYYLTSCLEDNYAFPGSRVEFLGLGVNYSFYKNTLDKLGVEMQVVKGRSNDFKSAVEPFLFSKMSDSSRYQTTRLLNEIWSQLKVDISKDIKIDTAKLSAYASNASITSASDAAKLKLLKGVLYYDEFLKILKEKAKINEQEDITFKSFEKYAQSEFYKSQSFGISNSKNKIAVILAEGEITVDGEELSSDKVAEYIREARIDKEVKTIVLRVNSPGGSALASDIIWREVLLANQSKKVVVSMGDVAASGGYFIAAPSSYIFAEPTTITGSIGVFGVIPYTGKFMEQKLGVTFDRVATNSHAGISLNKKMTIEEMAILQNEVDDIYDSFLSKVSEGRKIPINRVHAIARGRVWTGKDAKKIGLVDELGGIDDAIRFAAKQNKLKDFELKYWPKKEVEPIEELLEELQDMKKQSKLKTSNIVQIPEFISSYLIELQKIKSMKGVQMRLPITVIIE